MTKFLNPSNEEPYIIFREKFEKAYSAGQKNIDAVAISSYNIKTKEISSRFVNLKFIDGKKFIFFSNYNSPKSNDFETHNQISAVMFWSKTNFQIRIKANIFKTSKEYNQLYFCERAIEKNALAISSNQSQPISSFEKVLKNYERVKENNDLTICPDYWGGYYFVPYEIEFWEGNANRLNKRSAYQKVKGSWNRLFLEP